MGILVRSGPLAHPTVQQAILDNFVPVVFEVRRALPSWVTVPGLGDREAERIAASPEEDPEVAAFLKIHGQEPMSQGIWITTPDLKLLRTSYQTAPEPMLGTIEAALRDWRAQYDEPPKPLPKEALASEWPETSPCPPDVTRLKAFGRLLDGSNFEPFRDDVDIPVTMWQSILPEQPVVGQKVELPREFAWEIGSRIYSGEIRMRLRPEEIKELQLVLEVTKVADSEAEAAISGHMKMRGNVSFAVVRQREYDGQFRGRIRWQLGAKVPDQFLLVADGTWRAQYPEGTDSYASYDVYPAQAGGRITWGEPVRMLFLFEYPPVFRPKPLKGLEAQHRDDREQPQV